MKTRLFKEKLPELFDYALAIAISSVPGIAEADGTTRQLYQSITKELLTRQLKSKREFARRNLYSITRRRKCKSLKASA